MRNHLTIGGTDLATFGVYISGGGTFSAPRKAYNWYDVPARNGSVLGYERRLENIEVTYEAFIYTNFDDNVEALRNFLLSRDGLVRISDTYHPDEFRMGVYAGPFEPTVERKLDAGQFELTFICQPQRWLTSGEETITKTGSGSMTINNPTRFTAKPLLFVRGYGSLQINDTLISLAQYSGDIMYIDCETMNCWNGLGTQTQYVSFSRNGVSGVDAPGLAPGNNTLAIITPTTITNVMLTPRWWEV